MPIPDPPARDAYALRLVSNRVLYDGSVLVGATPAFGALVRSAVLLVHPSDRDRIGVHDGERVRVTSASGSFELPVQGPTVTPQGCGSSVEPPDGPAGALVDAPTPVTDLRVETHPMSLIATLAADPLFRDEIDLTVVLIVIVKTIVVFAILLVSVMFYIWFMRKVIADMQNRIGPQKAGPFGHSPDPGRRHQAVLQGAVVPDTADRPIFQLAPYLSIIPAFLAFAIVPIGGEVSIGGHRTYLQLADPASASCCC